MRIKSIKLDRGTVSSFFLMFVEELMTLALPMGCCCLPFVVAKSAVAN